MNYQCANFYANISTNVNTTDIFPFLAIFFHSIVTIFPPKMANLYLFTFASARQKGGDLTQSYDKSPYTNRNVRRAK